ncbi:MAG: hypothetical protein LQ345_003351, partial [Seirophora villosa]
ALAGIGGEKEEEEEEEVLVVVVRVSRRAGKHKFEPPSVNLLPLLDTLQTAPQPPLPIITDRLAVVKAPDVGI